MNIIIYSILAFWLLWVCYVAVMAAKRVRDDVAALAAALMAYVQKIFTASWNAKDAL